MPAEPESKHGAWVMYFTVAMLSLPVLYVLSSGPMKIGFERFGLTSETHERVYAPLVWLTDNTPAGGAAGWYWGLFPTDAERWNVNRGEFHDEYDVAGKEGRSSAALTEDDLGRWLYSPKARAIDRYLGVED